MAINPTIQLTSKTGTVKRIKGTDFTRDMRADALWHSSSAIDITTLPYTFKNSEMEWMNWEILSGVKVRFTADGSGADGQGYNVAGPGLTWKVSSVSGTVYIVRAKYLDAVSKKEDSYKNANRVAAAVNDVLYPNDAILCAKTANFEIELGPQDTTYSCYVSLGIVTLGTTD